MDVNPIMAPFHASGSGAIAVMKFLKNRMTAVIIRLRRLPVLLFFLTFGKLDLSIKAEFDSKPKLLKYFAVKTEGTMLQTQVRIKYIPDR